MACTAALATHEVAKQVFKHVRKRAGEVTLTGPTGTGPTGHTAVESRMTKPIISRLLVSVFQDVIRFIGLFELRLGIGIVRVPIRVQFLGLFAKGFFDFRFGSAAFDAQNLIVIAF